MNHNLHPCRFRAAEADALGRLGGRPEQQVQQSGQQQEGHDGKHVKRHRAGEQSADLIHNQGSHIGEAAHIADGGEAGSAQQIEDHEGIGRDGSVGALNIGGQIARIQHAEGGHHFLLGDEAGDGGHGGLPGAEAQGNEYPSHQVADGGQDGGVAVRHHAKAAVGEAKALEEPQNNR